MIGIKETKIGDLKLISLKKTLLIILGLAAIGILISYGVYNLLTVAATAAIESGQTGNDALDQINSSVASGSPLLISTMTLILPFIASLLIVVWYRQGQILMDTKLKDFQVMKLPKTSENQQLQVIAFRILADYCRTINIIDHPSDERLHLMSKANADKYFAARDIFLNLVEHDSELANISTVDFANLNLSPSQKSKIDSALLAS